MINARPMDPRVDSERSLIEAWRGPINLSTSQVTFADGFSGMGGVSAAARTLALRILWACDTEEDARETYRLNFPGVCMIEREIQELRNRPENLIVDILHLSIVCRYFSLANFAAGTKDHRTKGGQNDENNSALLLCVGEILKKVKPRILTRKSIHVSLLRMMLIYYTVEEVEGLALKGSNRVWFHSMIGQVTSHNYSVRWRIVDFAEHGLPAHRRRLILYASCAGQDLPEFPAKTHGPALRPYTTIRQAISGIPRYAPDHDPQPFHPSEIPSNPPDFDGLLPNIIMPKKHDQCHPNGLYPYTIRQFAHLQGCGNHKFPATMSDPKKKKLLGNSVPSTPFEPHLARPKQAILTQNARFRLEGQV